MSTGARTVTYRRRVGEGAADLAAVLGRLGLEPGPSVPARVTVLDSIDGRIHAVGADREDLWRLLIVITARKEFAPCRL